MITITRDELAHASEERLKQIGLSDEQIAAVRLPRVLSLPKLPPPQVGPQSAFLDSEADIVIYGGAAGGGKTYGLLLDFARDEFISNSGYGFVIFRRTSPEITNEGGLWDESQKLYRDIGGQARMGDHSWRFPSGAKGRFAHLVNEDDKHNWQGTQLTRIGFDELTHFTETQFFYLLSRNRSICGIKPQVRATCNPYPGWVKKFLAPWLDKSFGNPAMSGEVRWFTRVDGKIIWVDENYKDKDGDSPKSVTFIRSTVHDNKKLLAIDPGYLVNLKSLPPAEQARLLYGDWDMMDGAFFGEWSDTLHTCLPFPIPRYWPKIGGLDFGTAAPFSFHLLVIDETGNVTAIDEEYSPGLTDKEQAIKVEQCLERNDVAKGACVIYADNAMFPPTDPNKQVGEYPVNAFWARGLNVVRASQGPNSRNARWVTAKRYLHEEGIQSRQDGDVIVKQKVRKFRAFRGKCANLIRTIGTLPPDKIDPEDLDTKMEDHAVDSAFYALHSWHSTAVAPKERGFQDELNRMRQGENRPVRF